MNKINKLELNILRILDGGLKNGLDHEGKKLKVVLEGLE